MLGQGAYGSVVRKDGNAVKKFHSLAALARKKNIQHVPDIVTPSFLRESFAMAYLQSCEYVVKMKSSSMTSMTITMDLCDRDLRHWFEENYGKSGYKEKLDPLIKDMIKGLLEIHDRGLVHGDFKMSNVLMKDSKAYVGDCGFTSIAKYSAVYYTAEPYRDPGVKAHWTHDAYSLGCILYQLFTGKRTTYKDDKGRNVPFTSLQLRDRVQRFVDPKYKEHLTMLLHSVWQRRPSLRTVYRDWYDEEIPVWKPEFFCEVPETYPKKEEMNSLYPEARKFAKYNFIERFDESWYALCYYVSENETSNLRVFVGALLLICNSCFHYRTNLLKVKLEDVLEFSKCEKKDLVAAINKLSRNSDFVTSFYCDYQD